MSVQRFPIVLLALLLAVPSVSATWRGYGTFEPDNGKDSASFMYFDAPAPGSGRIYFNAFQSTGSGSSASLNPNLGTIGSRADGAGSTRYDAVLGRWTDCNEDGYMGVAEDALEEYPTTLLTPTQTTTVCPEGPNNNGGWVTEVLWIGTNWAGPFGAQNQIDNRIIADNASIVWGDDGSPNDARAPGPSSCPTTRYSRGSMQTVGGMLNVADCKFGAARRYNALLLGDQKDVLGTPVNTPGLDPTNAQGLVLSDPSDWRSNSRINQPTFGPDSSDNSVAHVQDCSKEPINKEQWDAIYVQMEALRPQKEGDGALGGFWSFLDQFFAPGPSRLNLIRPLPADLRVNPPQPSAGTPGTWKGGNAPGTANMTIEEAGTIFVSADCNYSNDAGHDFYGALGEADVSAGTVGRGKTAQDTTFNFSVQYRHNLPTPFLALNRTTFQAVTNQLPPAMPQCLGVYLVERTCFHTFWTGNGALGSTPFATADARRDSPVAPNTAHYATFYAHVALASGLTPGGQGIYGSGQCSIIGPGALPQNGWECDPALWYTNADKSPQTILSPHAKIGQGYELRDVDCLDGQIVAGLPVYVGSGTLNDRCVDPAP